MCAQPPLHRTEHSLEAGDRAAGTGLWPEAEHQWRAVNADQRLRWLERHRDRPRHRRRVLALWGSALCTSAMLTGTLIIGTPSAPVAVFSLGLTAAALVAMVLAALATGRWLGGTGTHRTSPTSQERT